MFNALTVEYILIKYFTLFFTYITKIFKEAINMRMQKMLLQAH